MTQSAFAERLARDLCRHHLTQQRHADVISHTRANPKMQKYGRMGPFRLHSAGDRVPLTAPRSA